MIREVLRPDGVTQLFYIKIQAKARLVGGFLSGARNRNETDCITNLL